MQKKYLLNNSNKYNQVGYTYGYVNKKQVSVIKSNENSFKPFLLRPQKKTNLAENLMTDAYIPREQIIIKGCTAKNPSE